MKKFTGHLFKNVKFIHWAVFIFGLFPGFYSCTPQAHEANSIVETNFEFEDYTITRFHKGYMDGRFTVIEVVESYLHRIEAIDKNGPKLNSIIQINPDAQRIAKDLDKELQNGVLRGPLHGIPVILKDNIDTHDQMATTAGSRALIDSHPETDSWVAAKLREAGAVIIAKANLSEWANFRASYSSSGWSGVGGQTKNPYDLSRNPCGSSSGSGVAVAANLCIVAIGTETNGSIMCPSNNNGIVGIKPTVGLISRSGIIPISYTQDTPGPMARTVEDAAICLGILTGIDSTDSKTLGSVEHLSVDYTQSLNKDGIRGKRIGLFKRPMGRQHKVDALMLRALEYLKSQGAEIIEIDKILGDHTGDLSYQVMLYEFKDGLNRYLASLPYESPVKSLEDLIRFNSNDSVELKYFDQKILENAQKKQGLDSPEYVKALDKMQQGSRAEGIDRVMDEYNLDAIAALTGGPAWKTDLVNGDNSGIGSSSPAAIAGYPSITVPMGFIGELPVGISFFGRAWSEALLIEIAYAYEVGTRHRKGPKFISFTE